MVMSQLLGSNLAAQLAELFVKQYVHVPAGTGETTQLSNCEELPYVKPSSASTIERNVVEICILMVPITETVPHPVGQSSKCMNGQSAKYLACPPFGEEV